MSLASLQDLIDERTRLLPLTVEQYHQMIAIGIVPEGEPYELLDGHVVRKDRSSVGEDPKTVGTRHAAAVTRLSDLGPKLKRFDCHLRTQQPVTLPPFDEPEPDAAIVTGTIDDYVDHHPGAEDVTFVIEVADASLRRDRTAKLRAYAAAGLAQYLIINLLDDVVEVHSEPLPSKARYQRVITLTRGQSVPLQVGGQELLVPVRRLLP